MPSRQASVPSGQVPLEAGTAGEVERAAIGDRRRRRRHLLRARAVEHDERPIERAGDMHQAGVVGDDHLRDRQQLRRLDQAGAPGEIVERHAGFLRDLGGDRLVLRAAEESHAIAGLVRDAGERREFRRRPALGRPVFGTPGQKAIDGHEKSRPSRSSSSRGGRRSARSTGRGEGGGRPGGPASATKRSMVRAVLRSRSERASVRRSERPSAA